jgi:Putative Actinobacterial Holin-X, holin superfamily III
VLSQDAAKPPTPDPRQEPSVSGLVQLVKDYARQETVGPIRGAGRWAAFGGAGAVLFAVGTILLMLTAVRVMQTETDAFDGKWMGLIPYCVALLIAVGVIALAISRIGRKSLQKEP